MTFLRRMLLPALATLCFANVSAEPREEILARATAAVEAATPRAQADPARPVFHITSPAQWMNDPNGPLYYKGFYHLFYQFSPFSDGGGPRYWGHVRSRDLVKWEALPIALWPSEELGEVEIWSGCCAINGLGQPMAFYTSIARGRSPGDHAEQWAAIGDDNLMTWRKSPADPVLTEALHGGKKIYDWRDPFIFHNKNKVFLVTGGNLNQARGGEGVVNIYEAQNPALTQWKYRGVLFHLPPEARTAECPNFFQVGNRWVLFVSPYGKVQYFVGDFDSETCRFRPHTEGLVDCGPNFYAPNTMQVPTGRRIVWGWVTGFPGGRGWNGCLSLPRVLSVSPDDRLRQTPAPELEKLRGPVTQKRNVAISTEGVTFQLPRTNTLEISAALRLGKAGSIEISLQSEGDKTPPLVMRISATEFKMPEAESPLALSGKAPEVRLRLFLDRSVLEVFVNETVCATKTMMPPIEVAALRLRAVGGTAEAKRIEAWPMKTIW